MINDMSLQKLHLSDHYDYLVDSDKEKDIFLKDVDLLAARKSYIETTIDVIEYITLCLQEYKSVEPVVPIKNRKHKHNKRK